MQQDYQMYQNCLWELPDFLEKYIELDIFQRLKGKSFLCGMKYASPSMYNFSCDISRYDHSINVARITWHFTNNKKDTLAALFHDIATPVFSHVIDIMNEDALTQESTEKKTYEILDSCDKLKEYLKEDGISLIEISDFKKYSIVDLDRPKLCADRIDGTLSSAMAWANIVDAKCCEKILGSINVEINEHGEEELAFDNIEYANYFKVANDAVNDLTHSKEDNYMMNLLANIVKTCIEKKIFTYDELFIKSELEIIELIENEIQYDVNLLSMWVEFKTIDEIPSITEFETKNRDINPIVLGRRIS